MFPYPTIRSTATTNGTSAGTSVSVNLPTEIQPGNLLIVAHRTAGAGAVGWPAGWTEVFENSADGSDDVTAWAWRKADGTEGSTITVTQGNVRFCSLAWRISDAMDPEVQAPESGTVATGSSTSPDPGSVTPTGGTKHYLFIALAAMEGEGALTAPSGYTLNNISATSGTAGGTASNCLMRAAGKESEASSDDPGVFTAAPTEDWTAWTIAVHPSPKDELFDGRRVIGVP